MHTRSITSLQHPIVKHLTKLNQQKEYRKAHNSIIMMGDQVVDELSNHLKFKTLIYKKGHLPPFSVSNDCQVYEVTEEILKKVAQISSAQSFIVECQAPAMQQKLQKKPLLILDEINDPGNLGTLFRSALAFGFTQVVLISGCCDPFNDKALRASRGAIFFIDILMKTREEVLEELIYSGFTLYGADAKGDKEGFSGSEKLPALVMGNEARGIHRDFKAASELISISIDQRVESLNVAIAASILMSQWAKGNK